MMINIARATGATTALRARTMARVGCDSFSSLFADDALEKIRTSEVIK
jgi:hypothetical protein